jgi:ABC-2 type transport system ATP-binding protein
MPGETILKVENITKEYGGKTAVSGASFIISAGEVTGLLGPNGAGKTTIINMILGILEPTKGTIEILGENVKNRREITAAKMNFAAVYAHLPANLTVYQNLYVSGLLYGVKNLKEKIATLLKEYDLEKFSNAKSGILSSGESSRLSLAKSAINDPRLLLLDEPTASLDPSVSRFVCSRIKKYATDYDAAVLWTSHNMREIEAVCDKIIFLAGGRIVMQGNPKTLPREHDQKDLEELFITIARNGISE